MNSQHQITPTARAEVAHAPSHNGILQRCACGGTPGPTGECAECRRKRLLQPKLTVNQPGDHYEQEADRVAEQILRMPAAETTSAPLKIQRVTAEADGQRKKNDDDEHIQAKEAPGKTLAVSPEVEARVAALRGGGEPLGAEVRAFMEQRFGYDFGQIRIHTDARAATTAQAVHARAFTVGHDIAFGAGQYQPGTESGRRLLAHELTHTLQQHPAPPLALNRWAEMSAHHKETTEEESASEPSVNENPSATSIERLHGPTPSPFAPAFATLNRPAAHHILAREDDDEPDLDTSDKARLEHTYRTLAEALFEGHVQDVLDAVEEDPDLFQFAELDLLIDEIIVATWAIQFIQYDIDNQNRGMAEGHLAQAEYQRRILLYWTLIMETWVQGQFPYPSVDDAADAVEDAAVTEEDTLLYLDRWYSTDFIQTQDILNATVEDFPEAFPETNLELYKQAEEFLRDTADAYKEDFDKELDRIVALDVEDIIPFFVAVMNDREGLRRAARRVALKDFMVEGGSTPRKIYINFFDPLTLSTSGGFKPEDIQLLINEWGVDEPADKEKLEAYLGPTLFPMLDTWFYFEYFDALAEQMKLFRISAETTLEPLNRPGEPASIETDLLRTYSNASAGLDATEKGFDEIYSRIQKRLDEWVQSLDADGRIIEGFGLYDVLGEVGQQLKAMATPEGVAMIAGFIAFLIAIQFVPYANIVVDIILLTLGGIDILKGLVIFGTYFDTASDARSFRSLYMASQGLKGGGEAILDLLMELLGLAAGKAIKSFKRYRDVKRFESLNDVAPIIDEFAGKAPTKAKGDELRDVFAKSRRAEATLKPWEQKLHPDAQAALSKDAALRRLYGEMDPDVRRLFMRCSSPCHIQLDPPPTIAQAKRINRILDEVKYKSMSAADKTRLETKIKDYLQARMDDLGQAITDIQNPKTRENLEALLDYFNAGGRVLGRPSTALLKELQQALLSLRVKTGIIRGRNASGDVVGGTVGVAKSDIPALSGKMFEGRSPEAGGTAHPAFKPPSSHQTAQGHAEQNLVGAIDDELKNAMAADPSLTPDSFNGTIWIHVEQAVCSTCKAGLANPEAGKGVLKQFSEKYPQITLEITAEGTDEVVGVRKGIRILR